MIRRMTAGLAAAGLLAAGALGPHAVADGVYDDPLLVNWPAALPATPATYDPALDVPASTEGAAPDRTRGTADCEIGSLACVDNVIDEMTSRWQSLACDHNGAFALTYLITTIQYKHSAETAGFYQDHEFLNHYDAVFADLYFEAYDDYRAGRLDEVPAAWRIAFEAADGRTVTGYGDMVLGMNAHIIRDLPFVIERIGLVDEAGASRHPDHSKVNVFLNEAGKIVPPRVAQVYDPTIYDASTDFEGKSTISLQLIMEWREEAWRKAELLHAARQQSPEAYAAVVTAIEADAAARAERYVEQYAADAAETAARDAYCAEQWPERDEAALLAPRTG